MPSLRRPPTVRLVVLLVAAIVGGCGASTPPSPTPSTSPAPSSVPTASASPATARPGLPTEPPSAADVCAAHTLASLTESQRIGQLFMVGLHQDHVGAALRDAIASFHFGSVAFTRQTAAGVDAVRATTDEVQALATETATGRVGFLVAANQEGGRIQALSGPGFDRIHSALAQGRLTPAKLESKADRWGRELLEAGVNLDLAPVADVVPSGTDAQNAPIGN